MKSNPLRDKMASESWYQQIDPGIRFAVRVLHAAGFDTGQSCQGGKGHSYDQPTVEMVAGGDDALGFGALNALRAYGLSVNSVSIEWPIGNDGHPFEKNWRITFSKPMPERANEKPIFVQSYRAL